MRPVLVLIAVSTVLRLGWAAALEPTNDEAYHLLYTEHPALSYFDHPPMMMWVAKAGIVACGGWVHPLSLRLGFVLLFAGSTWVLFRWTTEMFGEPAGFWAAVTLNLSGYYTAFGGIFALPDSPFLFFALLTFWKATKAVTARRRFLQRWAWVGVGFAGALLSKYHGVLLPAGVVLYAVLTPGRRRLLYSPGPYLAVLIGLVGFLPVIVWNAEHEWASFRFQGGRARDGSVTPFLHAGPLIWLAGPVVYLLPWIWFWLVRQLVGRLLRFRSLTDPDRLLVCLSVTPLAFFFVVSGLSPTVLMHWSLVGFLPLYPLVGAAWASWRGRKPRQFRTYIVLWTGTLFLLTAVLLTQVYFGIVPFPPSAKDPTADVSGWAAVADELDRRGLLAEPNTYLCTNLWYDSGQLAFAVRGRGVPVACFHTFDARGFAFWSRPEDYVGKTGLLVFTDGPDDAVIAKEYGGVYRSFTRVAEFDTTRGGRPFRRVRVFRGEEQLRPYPFDYKLAAGR